MQEAPAQLEEQQIVVVVEGSDPVEYRTSFEFFGGLLMFVLAVILALAAVLILATVGVLVAVVILSNEMRRGWKLDRDIARRLP